MEFKVSYIEHIIGNHHHWNINGIKVKLRISKRHKNKVEKALYILSFNLKNNRPIYEAVELVKVHECLVLIDRFLLAEFLQYIETYMKDKISEGKEPTLAKLIEDMIKKNLKFPLGMFAREETKELMQSIALYITEGCIPELDIKNHMLNGRSMNHIADVLGIRPFIELIVTQYVDKLEDYIDKVFQSYAYNRELLTYNRFCQDYIGGSYCVENGESKIVSVIKPIVMEVYTKYLTKLIEGNLEEINSKKDIWKIYQLNKDLSVSCSTLDFTIIKSEKFRIDYKRYYKNYVRDVVISDNRVRGITNHFSTSIKVVNFLYEERGISCFGEITSFESGISYQYLKNNVVDDKKGMPLGVTTISKIITLFRKIIDYLIENYSSTINHPIPQSNVYNSIKVRNKQKMYNKIDVIPENVFKQLQMHKSELNSKEFQRMFDIFEGTGMRLKEVRFLEEDCLEYTNNAIYLSYIPYKVLISRRKAKREDRHTIEITKNLAKIIEEQKEVSKNLRKEFDMNEIFLTDVKGKTRVIGEGFTKAINKLIKKYKICDLDGELWSFDSRQMRKTVAAIMIENGATETEIMQQLNHIRVSTTRKHYEDLEKSKLSDLNAEFFKKEFEVTVGQEQLKLYTEEEKKALIIDFKLSKREVEFGYCVKHKSEGHCKKRIGKINCANCPKLCTGKKYIDKWESLITNQMIIIKELEEEYSRDGIQEIEYKQFVEYRKEKDRLDQYEAVRAKILEEK